MSDKAKIEADANLPIIRITRDFAATPAQLLKAHTDPDIYMKWVGPHGTDVKADYWDARTGGNWRFEGQGHAFHGCFHEVSDTRIVQTFTWEGWPESVSLETMTFEDLGDGRTRLHVKSLVDSFEARDQWLESGMETGVNDGYEKLDGMLADGEI
jgi:uncharacterized protein YndB with AHSA1/START domain